MQDKAAHVVITRAPEGDYLNGCVSLPDDYATTGYYQREDIRAIFKTVENNLAELDSFTGFTNQLRGREVLIKPNLVMVFHHLGTLHPEYPESTDPRVLDALVTFLKEFTNSITIIESSGRGIPTRGAFHLAGYDRIARNHRIRLAALEEQPISRYLLPHAKVMMEVALPKILDKVVDREAFFISLPKMKTNLYTGVTLGIKGSMGLLPYNLRQRNHNFALNQKLVDLFSLIQPDLTIIDGIVGGEGNCPAPVDAVDSRIIISSNQTYECDRIATQLMGIDPKSIPLIRLAEQAGFQARSVEIHGDTTPFPFKHANPSLTGSEFTNRFPTVRLYTGFSKIVAEYSQDEKLSENIVREMELRCRGGCLASTRFAFDMLHHEGITTNEPINLFIGDGVPGHDGNRYYFSWDGSAIDAEEIQNLPNTLAIGSCSSVSDSVKKSIPGCMPYPNAVHVAIHQFIGKYCRIVSFKNRHFIRLLINTLQTCEKRKSILRSGQHIDLPLQSDDQSQPIPNFQDDGVNTPWIKVDLPPLSRKEIELLCHEENKAVLATFR